MENSLFIDLLKLVAVAVLVLANAFFVAAEFSLVSVRRTRVAELIAQGNPRAKWVQTAIENPDRVIAATQLGITIASLGLGWIGEPALAHLIQPVVALFPGAVQSGVSHSLSAGLAFAVITFLHVVVGELAPKSVALQNPEGVSLAVSQPTVWTEMIFKPLIWALNGAGNALLRLVGVEPATGHQLAHSVEELKMLVSASAAGGVVAADESEMLHAIFDLSDLLVRQVMIPRTEIIAVEADAGREEIIQLVTQTTYTKFPVYEDNLDQILGIVHVKDLLRVMQSGDSQDYKARDLVRETMYVPETISVGVLLHQFRDNRQHIAIVLDEYGGTAGLVTLEDLLEEIVGEVSDPFDESAPEIQTMPDGSAMIDGLTLIEEVNDELGLQLQDTNYDTIAGYVLGRLGRIPRLHDVVDGDGVRLRVEAMDGMRIARLSLKNLSGNIIKKESAAADAAQTPEE
ncbi:MAG: hemolysin family protein [Anaerolineales bacterium]|nr:hemolysin family protein [Anaerolineales bacterium]